MERTLSVGRYSINLDRLDWVEWDNGSDNPNPRVLLYIGGRAEPLVVDGEEYTAFLHEFNAWDECTREVSVFLERHSLQDRNGLGEATWPIRVWQQS